MTRDRFTPVRPAKAQGPRRTARYRTGLALVVVGILLFVTGNIGARIGVVVLPFDPHHVLGQLGGPAIGLLGAWLLSQRR
ncbi:MAG: hypothetical protein ACRDQF_19215 [Thermocrispum sp.]